MASTFKILQDQWADNPCAYDDGYGPFLFFWNHRRYTGGHKDAVSPWVDDNPHSGEFIPGVIDCLTVYGYEHGGLSISTSHAYPFNCRWDSGILGAIYYTKDSLEKSGCKYERPDDALDAMRSFIKHYDDYLQGENWLIEWTDETGNTDCLGGFTGSDIETNGILDNFPKEDHDAIRAAWEARIFGA